jgi:hypothetical protein
MFRHFIFCVSFDCLSDRTREAVRRISRAPILRRPDRESEPLLPKTNTFSRKKRKPYLRRIAARNNEIRQRYWPSPAIPRLYRIVERRISFSGAHWQKEAGRTFGPAGCVLGFDQKSIRACRRRRTSE